mmetsp:Transcript_47044/g.91833  ORF Transcript_47044/g.91833 Transcript_47044/m.91833 type:complete len:325 (-) Transcript_47044:415-1389(-)
MPAGSQAQEPVLINRDGKFCGRLRRDVDPVGARRTVEEPLHLPLVFLREQRAGGVDEPPSGTRQPRGPLQHLPLQRDEVDALGRVARRRPPPPGAHAAAGGVHEHRVEFALPPLRPGVGPVGKEAPLRVAHAAACEPALRRGESARVHVERPQLAPVGHLRREGQRLAPRSGAVVHDGLAPTSAATSWDPSFIGSTYPSSRPGTVRRSTRSRRRMPSGLHSVGAQSSPAACISRIMAWRAPPSASLPITLSVLTRRSSGAGRCSARSSDSTPASPNAASRGRHAHSGHSNLTRRSIASVSSGPGPRRARKEGSDFARCKFRPRR